MENRFPVETNFTTVTVFVDTNVLVYAEDKDAKSKHEVARDLVADLWRTREGVLSIQILQEFFVTVTRKMKHPLTATRAGQIVREYLTWRVVDNAGALLVAAVDLHQKAKLSFWDAMVVQAAISAGSERLYSEDLNDGQWFGSLRVVNPFA